MYKTLKRCPAEFLYRNNLVRKTKQNKKTHGILSRRYIFFSFYIFTPFARFSPIPSSKNQMLTKILEEFFFNEGQGGPVLVFKISGAV